MSHTLLQGWGKTVRLLLNTRGKCEWTVPFGTNANIVANSCKSDGFSDRCKKERLSSVKQGFYFLILKLILWATLRMFLIPFQTLLKILSYSQKHLTVPWLSTVGCGSFPSDNNLYWMGEVLVIWWGQIDFKLRIGRSASLLPRTTGTLKGVLQTEVKGPVLMKADLQLSHYLTGREGRGVTKVFKYSHSKINFFVFHRRGARHMTKTTVCSWPVF